MVDARKRPTKIGARHFLPQRIGPTAEDALMLRLEARAGALSTLDVRGSTDSARSAAMEMRHRQEWAPLRDMDRGDDD